MDDERYRRRCLRLGALLFQLRYYQQAPDDIASGTYRAADGAFARLTGETVILVRDGVTEAIGLEDAIARCKAVLRGEATLHQGSDPFTPPATPPRQ